MIEEEKDLKIGDETLFDEEIEGDLKEIPHSSFDPTWYLGYYTDVRESGMDAAHHYLKHGIYEGRHPTEISWRASLPSVEEGVRRDLVQDVCRIISGADADHTTIDRYCHSLNGDIRSVVQIARELINEREITQRAMALEKKLQMDRRTKMRVAEPVEVSGSSHQPARSPWTSREGGKSRLISEELSLSNILDSRKTLDMGEARRRNGRTEDGPIDGQSLADLARSKRSTILNSI